MPDYPNRSPVYGQQYGVWKRVGTVGTKIWKTWSFPWGWSEYCLKGKHVVIGSGVGKQIHCPVCQPDWKGGWRNIWNTPTDQENRL